MGGGETCDEIWFGGGEATVEAGSDGVVLVEGGRGAARCWVQATTTAAGRIPGQIEGEVCWLRRGRREWRWVTGRAYTTQNLRTARESFLAEIDDTSFPAPGGVVTQAAVLSLPVFGEGRESDTVTTTVSKTLSLAL